MLLDLRRWSYMRVLFVVALLSIAGCATQLAPPYDKNVAEGLTAANTEAMTLMATTSQGTDKSTFSSREEKYNALIGKLDALALLAGARPMPKNKVTDTINQLLEKRGGKPIDNDDATPPSAHSIKKLAETLTKMRDTDRKQGVTAYEAQAFKGQLVIYFDQAVTYENFLQR
ncbi:MAG: hypothetical protein P9E88_14375 [Candidatus Competibacter sp.]|nr:hypothetical protein [Candidatus Competibacter sp.]